MKLKFNEFDIFMACPDLYCLLLGETTDSGILVPLEV